MGTDEAHLRNWPLSLLRAGCRQKAQVQGSARGGHEAAHGCAGQHAGQAGARPPRCRRYSTPGGRAGEGLGQVACCW